MSEESPQPRRRPTMADVAREAGVSKAAVSLALRRHPNIPEGTRLRIEEAAARLGYKTNPLVAANMVYMRSAKRSDYQATIAYLVTFPVEEVTRGVAPVADQYRGALERTEQLGYKLEVFDLNDEAYSRNRISRVLKARGIHGVIVSPLRRLGMKIELDWNDFALATIGYSVNEPRIHRSCPDVYTITRDLLSDMSNRGYRKIGFASRRETDARGYSLAKAAYLMYQDSVANEYKMDVLVVDPKDRKKFASWFERNKPDAIVTPDGTEVKTQLTQLGYRVPEDVGVGSYFWMPDKSDISGFYQNYHLEGAAAVDLVVAQLQRNERGIPEAPKLVLLHGEWQECGSLR